MRNFSLRSLLLICLIAALVVSNASLFVSYRRLTTEVRQLRRETGRLVPVDDAKINVMAVPQKAENVWQWRVYSPHDATLAVGIRAGETPSEDVPDDITSSGLRVSRTPEWGELWTLTVSSDLAGNYVLRLSLPGGHSSRTVTLSPEEWLSGGGSIEHAGGEVEAFDFGEPIVLRRVRLVDPKTLSTSSPTGPGYMAWVVLRRK